MKRVLIGAIIALAATACSAEVSKTLNTADVEAQVSASILEEREVEVEVACPDDVEAEEGGRFTCTATDAEGTSLDVDVIQVDSSGDVDWTLAMLDLATIETQIAPLVSDSVGVPITVECDRVLVKAEPGSSVDCRATDESGGSGVLRITATDDEGNVDWELNP